MDGFTIASCIASCAEETIAYNDVPTVLIGPYFPHETLSIKEFISFRLPSLQTHVKNPSSYLSSKLPSMDILSENDMCSLDHPSQLDMKRLVVIFNPDDENPFISVEIGPCCVPIVVLEIWRVHLQLWDLQNLWKDSLRQAESLMMQCPSQWPAIHISVDLHVADGMKRFKAFQVLGEVLLGS